MRPCILLAAVGGAAILAACGTPDEPEDREGTQLELCKDVPLDTFEVGMALSGDAFTVTLLAADFDPPRASPNTWSLAVADATGAPVSDAAAVVLVPFMDIHGHGTSPPEFTGVPTGVPGEFVVGPFDLIMAGPWAFTFDISDGGAQGTVEAAFCVLD